ASMLSAHPQVFEYPTLPVSRGTVPHFIPEDWSILHVTSGYLLVDHSDHDLAIVLQYKDTATLVVHGNDWTDTIRAKPRMLAVLSSMGDSTYLLRSQNNVFIMEHADANMPDPLVLLEIKDDLLRIGFSLWASHGTWWVENA